MNRGLLARAVVLLAMLVAARASAAADDATLFRVFLKDGGALVSYGEPARVGDRVVFSVKTGAAPTAPLHLVDLDGNLVDWVKTDAYAYSARATRYLATRADADYALLASDVARTLSAVAFAQDAETRLRLVRTARAALANWPRTHYNFRQAEVQQLLGMLDDAIADLQGSAGGGAFDLSLVAYAAAPPAVETLLPPPTAQESIEQVLLAAQLSEAPAERESLLAAAVGRLDAERDALPAEWAASIRATATAGLKEELALDRSYQALVDNYGPRARDAAKRADVHGIEWILTRVAQRDEALGGRRPDVVNGLVAEVTIQLDAARRLRLARDRWLLRLPAYREYNSKMKLPLSMLGGIDEPLEEIRTLAGATPAALVAMERDVRQVLQLAAGIEPPEELAAAHALVVSAANLAANAVRMRREAVLSGDMARAWDAASAAAGALMLGERARDELQAALRQPELP